MVEIACDESGSEGDKLIGGNTAVFAHASVVLSVEVAAACVQEARDRIRSPATEYKANHLLREKHRAVLVWLLSPDGPISGHARVYLVDKAYFAASRMLDLLGSDEDRARFHTEGMRDPGWTEFLGAFNDLVRGRGSMEEVGGLRRQDVEGASLDPLVQAISRAVEAWGARSVVHDQTNALTPSRMAELVERHGLTGFRQVDSQSDARIQVADFLAGTARKIAEEDLHGRGDPELTQLLRPFVDPCSVWLRGAVSSASSCP
ncbi:DUF3800 domain-containing protein [Nonomuraea sp. NPDC050556]|uniref:DUF3800 domain-containing protein n=1 Tax=Nonomuraea sp. NPDC050556 TaxID=3364369 RepID=UPI00379ADB3F